MNRQLSGESLTYGAPGDPQGRGYWIMPPA